MGQRMAGKVDLISSGASGPGEVQAALYARESAVVRISNLLEAKGVEVDAKIVAEGGLGAPTLPRLQSVDPDGHGRRTDRYHPWSAFSRLVRGPLYHRRGIVDRRWLVRRLLNAAEH